MHDTHALKLLQSLDFEREPDHELISDNEQDNDIEPRSASMQNHEQDLDVLCLETACAGVLLSLWCEITIYARDYALPECVLRAMVECAFLSELDRELPFVQLEEDPVPLTRAQYLRVLQAARRKEKVRAANAKYPYRVPDDKWNELLRRAKGRCEPGSPEDNKKEE